FTVSANYPSTTGLQPSYAGSTDAFVTRLDSSGATSWSTYLGGTNTDFGYAVALDSGGNVLVAGRTGGLFPVSSGTRPFGGGGGDGFVARLAPNGAALTWASYVGGDDQDYATGVAAGA